jgi:hypothetical protein
MFQPKKTIPKLILGALALSGCGDSGADARSEFQQCLSELGQGAAELCRQISGNDAYGDAAYGDDGYGYGAGYGNDGYGGYGDNGGAVLPDNDPNPTNDPFLPGGDSFYGG